MTSSERDHPANVTSATFNVWEGVYPSFQDAPVRGLGFDDPTWHSRSLAAAREARSDAVAGRPLEFSLRQRNSVLVTVVATLLAKQRRVRILDFGGGPAFGFLVLEGAIPNLAERVDYHIVEVEGVCREAPTLFDGRRAPTFHTTSPDLQDVDVVFTASTLQYIDDWRAICRLLASRRAPYLALSDVFAGAFASFVTLQQYYGSAIAHWFLNETELVREIESTGYALQLKTGCDVRVLDTIGELPMGNFPADRRLERSSHLLFSLSEGQGRV